MHRIPVAREPCTPTPLSPAARTAGTLPSPLPLSLGVLDDNLESGFESFRAWRDIISPALHGLDNLPPPPPPPGGASTAAPSRPLLFVGNHTQFGMYDMPLLFMEMYTRGYVLTGLADPDHWKTPLGPFFETFGAVPANAMSAYRALRAGKSVLLFPGALPRPKVTASCDCWYSHACACRPGPNPWARLPQHVHVRRPGAHVHVYACA